MKKLLLAIVSLVFLNVAFAADTKIGVIDLYKILQSAPQVKSMQSKLKKEFDPKQKEIEKAQNALRGSVEKYRRDSAVMKEADKKQAQEKIADEQKKLQVMQTDFQQKLVEKRNKLMSKILKKVEGIVNGIAKKGKYDIIVTLNSIAYHKPDMDITAQVIKKLK